MLRQAVAGGGAKPKRMRPWSALSLTVLASGLVAAAPPGPAPRVAIDTPAGTIIVALDAAHAPVTTRNFLAYVDAHAYDGTSFYRTVRQEFNQPAPGIQIIQGGLHDKAGGRPPIAVEKTSQTHLHNTSGTIAMARTSEPGSATSEFFINTADDTMLDAEKFSDGFGYAVFGRVVRGMDVVSKIQHAPAEGQNLAPAVAILRIRRVR